MKINISLLYKVINKKRTYNNSMAKKTLKKNEDGEKLRMYLYNLPLKESAATALKLAEACKVPYYTISNWRSGRCRIPELAKDKIEEVTGVKIFHSENLPPKSE